LALRSTSLDRSASLLQRRSFVAGLYVEPLGIKCSSMLRAFSVALLPAVLLTAACGSSDSGTQPGQDGATESPGADSAGDLPSGTEGLIVSLRTVLGDQPATPPFVVAGAGATISSGALWIATLSLISDQGESAAAALTALPFDAGTDIVDLVLAAAPPGLYSLLRVQIAAADATPLPAGFDGQDLSIRAAGLLDSGRSFTISDADSGSVDLRADVPMELKAGSQLHVTIDVDLGAWLSGLSFDMGDASQPFVVGPDGNGGFRDDFRANVLGSFRLSLGP
jgi:hypothetical protein